MERILKQRHGELVEVALSRLPPKVRWRIERKTDFLLGVDPIFCGFAAGPLPDLYRSTASCFSPYHSTQPKDPRMTVVLPRPDYDRRGRLRKDGDFVLPNTWESAVVTLIHEMGHSLHHEFECAAIACKTTPYSRQDIRESFAEQFAIRYMREYHLEVYGPKIVALADGDETARTFFETVEQDDGAFEFYLPAWHRRRFAWT